MRPELSLLLLLSACRAVEPAPPVAPASPPRVDSAQVTEREVGPSLWELVAAAEGDGSSRREAALPSRRPTFGPLRPSTRSRLERTTVSGLHFEEEESLREVIDFVRLSTGLPLVVTQSAEEAVIDAGILFDLHLEHPISVRHLLDLLVELAQEEIGWSVRHGAVILSDREDVRPTLVSRAHDVRAVVRPRTDFHAPRIPHLGLGEERSAQEDDGYGRSALAAARIEPERLVEMIRATIAPENWEQEGVSIEVTESGLLLVRHTPDVQSRVASFVARLGI